MKLAVDVGNSRIKWARLRGGRFEPGGGVDRREPVEAVLARAWQNLEAPSAVLVSSVAGAEFDGRLGRWMTDRWGCRPRWFRATSEMLGLVNGYAEPAQLGSDRWAAVVGARGSLDGRFGVIDAGTAITLDAVAGDRHLGGLILPGPGLAARSLVANTGSIREASREISGVLGRRTGECVANGVGLGLAGAVERCMNEVEAALGGMAWTATGGAWPGLSRRIGRTVPFDPDLVLKGLARVMQGEGERP